MNLPRWSYTAGWALLGLALAGLEITALVDPDAGDTLSEHVWGLLGLHPILWWLGAAGLVWATRHFLQGGRDE